MRAGDLADIVGVQVAWWQLGFRGRRAVLRRAGREGADAGDEVGRAWATQVLLAPWWWRAARTASAAGAALLVAIIAEGLLSEIDSATVAVLATVPAALAVTAAMTWRQTRWARRIAGPAGARARPQSVHARGLRLAVAGLLAVAALAEFLQSAAGAASDDVNCRIQPTDPRFSAMGRGGGSGAAGPGRCAVAEPVTQKDGIAWVQEANGTYLYWFPSLGADVSMSPAVRTAWLRFHDLLGDPVDTDRPDGDARYVNFVRGYILEPAGRPPVVAAGRHLPAVGAETCAAPDRPCVTLAGQDDHGAVQLTWSYPVRADAFNVSYWVVGRRDIVSYEVARTHFTLPAPEPGVTYGFQVQACHKHLLARSTCTPNSNSVAVSTH